MGRARIEFALATLTGAMAILTAVWPQWIEDVLGFDPDHGNGTLEWLIVVVLAVVTAAVAALGRRDLRVARHRAPIGTVAGGSQ